MWTCPKCGREFKNQNQDHYCGQAPKTIDEYIAGQPEKCQPYLKELREAIRDAIPEAEERISWSMPTWKKKGNIIHFAAGKNHIGVYPGEDAVSFFEEQLEGFETHKGVIRLKLDQELPLPLIADIAKWCFAQDQMDQKK